MQSQINKWGNSAAIRIPASILADSGLSVHSNISIEVKDGCIIIEPAKVARKSLNLPFSEASLLQNLNAHNSHADEVAELLASEFGD